MIISAISTTFINLPTGDPYQTHGTRIAPKNIMNRPTALDLFSGAGGFSLGMEQAGFEVVGAVESDPATAGTHSLNFPNSKIYCKSVASFTRHDLPAGIKIDVVVGGPPCQGFSVGGKRDSNDPRNNLVLDFMRVVGEVKPKYFVIENVPAMASADHFPAILKMASRAGYHPYYDQVNAINFGVAQNRPRIFIVGVRDDLPQSFFHPEPITSPEPSLILPRTPTIGESLAGLPELEKYDFLFNTDRLEWQFPKINGRSVPGFLTGCQRTRHSLEVVARFNRTAPGKREPISRFWRLDDEGYSHTLRAGTGSDRGYYTAPRPIHPTIDRVISVREGARLMGFPDWFTFAPVIKTAFRQIGNSVAPPVARAIGGAILRHMELIKS